jgi:uncharacterized protein
MLRTESIVYTIAGKPHGFEWDPSKRESNLQKHGIDFIGVPEIYDHPVLEVLDARKDYGEERWLVLGMRQEELLSVVLTYRKDFRRIISARKANRHEEKIYRAQRQDRLGSHPQDEG